MLNSWLSTVQLQRCRAINSVVQSGPNRESAAETEYPAIFNKSGRFEASAAYKNSPVLIPPGLFLLPRI